VARAALSTWRERADAVRRDRPLAHTLQGAHLMMNREMHPESGKVGYAIAWLLGVPIPILLIVYLVSRCA
jgi:hypothetical protein